VVDRDLLRRKLTELAEHVTQVSEYRDLTVERHRADRKTQRIVERTLQMASEACLDVASHVLADRGLRAPSTYAETFEILVQEGSMSPGLGRAMVEMTGFRNVIVHEHRCGSGDPGPWAAPGGLSPVRDRGAALGPVGG
jgi:uncharacterized protein YutE (UPF0331/DUF86 family)